MATPVLHQFSDSIAPGDAISDHALLIQRWLRHAGYRSELYAAHFDPREVGGVRPLSAYRPESGESHVIYHHSIGSDVADFLCGLAPRHIMVYHNITPPEFFTDSDPALAAKLARGRRQLPLLRPRTALALGVSPFNEAELSSLGFAPTGVLPITFDPTAYDTEPDAALLSALTSGGPLLLFVGRVSPHKRLEDLIKLLFYYRRLQPTARLAIVGGGWLPAYDRWLRDLVQDLGLATAVDFAGHISHRHLVTYFQAADLYVSMSEHEGFGKPFIESMYLGLPIIAYSAAGVPGTLGDAGVLFHEKNYPALAELVDVLISDATMRERLEDTGRRRLAEFSETVVRRRWHTYLQRLHAPQLAK